MSTGIKTTYDKLMEHLGVIEDERNALLREIDLLKAELSAVQMMNSIKAKALNKLREVGND